MARWFPSKLYHRVPDWVECGALFHIRIALDRTKQQAALIDSPIGEALMESAKFYDRRRWHITVFMLMPDHIHALLSFQQEESMSRIIGDGNISRRIFTESSGRRATSITACATMNEASSFAQRSITSDRIPSRQVSAQE